MSNQCEKGPSPRRPRPEGQGLGGSRPGLSLRPALSALRSPSSVDVVPPSPTWEHFLRASVISWGSQDGEGTLQHPETTALRGKLFAHRLYSLFVSAPPAPTQAPAHRAQRGSCPSPSPSPDLHRVLFPAPAPRGAHGHRSRLGRNSLISAFVFSLRGLGPSCSPLQRRRGTLTVRPGGPLL